jgi:polyisoprenoid-binding protein YceI
MQKSILAFVGAVSLLAIGAGGIGSLLIVKDRLRIEVSLDAPTPDTAAMLADDLRSLQSDFSSLGQALETQFGGMAEASVRAEADRREGQGQLVALLESLQRSNAQQQARIENLERRIHDFAASAGSAKTAPDTAIASQAAPAAVVEVPAAHETKAAQPAEPSAEKPAVQAAAPDAKPTKGFLGFKLPGRSFQFDQEQSFEVIPELSRVGFDAKSTLHDFTGVTTKVHGTFTAKLSDPKAAFTGAIVCEAAGLDSGVEGRDEAMLEHLDAKEHPEIRFTAQSFVPDENGVDAAKMLVKGTVTGLMSIRGVEKPLSMPVALKVEPSRRLMIEGQAKVHLPDFSVPVPDKVVIKMEPDVTVWIDLRARVAAGAERAK